MRNLTNAITKARKMKCHARPLGNRRYLITTPQQHRYVVSIEIRRDRLRYASCNCAAGTRDLACYHLVPAALLDTAISGYMPPPQTARRHEVMVKAAGA